MTRTPAAAFRPLAGVRVVDFSRIIAGPLCTMYLADLGADVVKVERGGTGDDARDYVFPGLWSGNSTIFLAFNRGKRSVALDLAEPADLRVAQALVADADVVVENFRPGVMDKLGLGYDALRARNARLVYCGISGFGSSGPLAELGANDLIAQAFCGLMSLNRGADDRPHKVAPAVIDLYTGLNAALAIVAALRERDRTGRGTRVDTSLFECGTSMLSYFATYCLSGMPEPDQAGPSASITVPNQVFPAADGWIAVAASNERMWQRLCEAIGDPALAADERFATNVLRTQHKAALVAILEQRFARETRATWTARLEAAKVSCTAVLRADEVLEHPQAQALGLIQPLAHPGIEDYRVVRNPVRYDGEVLIPRRHPPSLGEHDAELRAGAGARTDEEAGP